MLYPLYVWKDEDSAYGGCFPDLPGVFTAADEVADLPLMAQEAVLAHGEPIPAATTIDHWRNDAQFHGGFWMLVEINPAADRPGGPGRG